MKIKMAMLHADVDADGICDVGYFMSPLTHGCCSLLGDMNLLTTAAKAAQAAAPTNRLVVVSPVCVVMFGRFVSICCCSIVLL